jgi:trigger factor
VNAASQAQLDVSVESRSGLERSVVVRVPIDQIEQQVDQRLTRVGKTARLKGFRPGKVPHKVLRQHYGGQVRQEVVSDVIRSSLARALAQEQLNAAGGPAIELLKDGGDSHLAYRATFEVFPEVKLRPLSELSFDVPSVEIADSDVDEVLERLREQSADLEVVDRPSRADDRITVDFSGTIDGEPFEGGQGEDVAILIGAGQVIDDFDAALVGLSAGESRTAEVSFPDDYPAAELAGKQAVFEITAKQVEEKVLPALDDDFAAKFGVAEGGVEGLRTDVRANMQRELDQRLRAETRRSALEALREAHSIDVPKALIEDEISMLQQSTMRQLGIDDAAKAPPREEFRETASRRAALALLIQELIRERELKADRARIDARISELAAGYENPQQAAQQYRASRDLMAQIESGVLEEQAVELLADEAQTTPKAVEFSEFMR